jgi:signal transduction histidine kinase
MVQPSEASEGQRAPEEALKSATELAHASQAAAVYALTASLAHQISQPLSGIIANTSTCARMLAAAPPDITGAQGTIRRLLRDVSRAAELIATVRAMFGEWELTLQPFDLNAAVREVIVLSSADLARSAIAVGSALADDLPPILGNRRQLQLVIVNLIRHACDATLVVPNAGRKLLVRTERETGNGVRVTLRDTDLDLPPASAAALSGAAHNMESDGLGIGLFVSRSIIERHRGRLWAERNAGAPGTTFSFSIPSAGRD